ncbi:unnamed protein product [Eretmochelys imbricata]
MAHYRLEESPKLCSKKHNWILFNSTSSFPRKPFWLELFPAASYQSGSMHSLGEKAVSLDHLGRADPVSCPNTRLCQKGSCLCTGRTATLSDAEKERLVQEYRINHTHQCYFTTHWNAATSGAEHGSCSARIRPHNIRI